MTEAVTHLGSFLPRMQVNITLSYLTEIDLFKTHF